MARHQSADGNQMRWLATAAGFLITLAAALQFPRDRIIHGQNDFISYYAGAKLSGTGQLRSVEAQRTISEHEAHIWIPGVLFIRPDYYAILLRPLAWFPYLTAYWLFQAVSLAALLAFLWLFRREPNLWMFALCSIPLAALFANGQDVTLLMLAFAGAVLLDRRGMPFAAGLLLSLCTVKFHLFLFVPLALIAHRRWRMIAGACAGTAACVVAATLVEGRVWISRYAEFLKRPELHPLPFPLNFHAVALMFGWGDAGEWVLTAAVAGCLLWFAWRRVDFGTLISLCLLGGMLVAKHLGLHDYALVLVFCALSEGLVKQGFCWLTTPPVYICMLLPDPWSAMGIVFVSVMFALPFFELNRESLPEAKCITPGLPVT
jgi:hypothetical protein